MRIGIDLRPLQNGHKYRGIGEVAKQVTNRILELGEKDGVKFVFYQYEDDDPAELLDIPKGLTYKTNLLGLMPDNKANIFSRKQKLARAFNSLYGTPIKSAKEVDVFLQYDYSAGVPKNTKTLLIKHDIIPYIFWNQYFESAWIPFRNKALRTTLRTLFTNHKFMRLLRRGLKDAHAIVTVSESTKNDIQKYFSVKPQKVKVARLGVDMKPAKTNNIAANSARPTKPYLLFIGAGDARRRVEDLVAAFNNLRAKGYDIQLVLAGENFQKPEHIPNENVRNAVLASSYKKDILTLGYISDEQKQELFKNAVAYVYPTLYEGFGIPILEAMLLGCAVVVYKNSSTYEVGGDYAIYAQDWMGLVHKVEGLLKQTPAMHTRQINAARKHAEAFTWDKTARVIYQELKSDQL